MFAVLPERLSGPYLFWKDSFFIQFIEYFLQITEAKQVFTFLSSLPGSRLENNTPHWKAEGDYNESQWLKPYSPRGTLCISVMFSEFIHIVSYCPLRKVLGVFWVFRHLDSGRESRKYCSTLLNTSSIFFLWRRLIKIAEFSVLTQISLLGQMKGERIFETGKAIFLRKAKVKFFWNPKGSSFFLFFFFFKVPCFVVCGTLKAFSFCSWIQN